MAFEFEPRNSDSRDGSSGIGSWDCSTRVVVGGSALAGKLENLANMAAETPMRIAALAHCLRSWRIGFVGFPVQDLFWIEKVEEEALTQRSELWTR